MRALACALTPFIFAYLGAAFVMYDLNAGNWTVEARGFAALFGGVGAYIIVAFCYYLGAYK